MPLEEVTLVAGTEQNLSNLLFIDIYGLIPKSFVTIGINALYWRFQSADLESLEQGILKGEVTLYH